MGDFMEMNMEIHFSGEKRKRMDRSKAKHSKKN